MAIAAIIIFIILCALAGLQAALAAGAPIGRFAWGGQHDILPARLRIGSALSIAIYVLLMILVASKAGVTGAIAQGPFLDISLWVATIYLTIGVVVNAISRSRSERYTMTPLTAVLAVCFLIVALV